MKSPAISSYSNSITREAGKRLILQIHTINIFMDNMNGNSLG